MTSDLPVTRALRGVYVLGAQEMLRPHLLLTFYPPHFDVSWKRKDVHTENRS